MMIKMCAALFCMVIQFGILILICLYGFGFQVRSWYWIIGGFIAVLLWRKFVGGPVAKELKKDIEF